MRRSTIFNLFCLLGITFSYGQGQSLYQTLDLSDLSAFDQPGKNWRISGSVMADLSKDQAFTTEKGTGILVNLPTQKAKTNLFTQMEHGDIDLELEFMMAKHSNSGIYLQGRYEIQLLDSWGKGQPYFGDLGGVYQRWDESQPKGEEGFEGKAPRENAALAPGLWQKMSLSFQAPRFNEEGKKTQNARLLRLELNGVVLHENLDLTGPTRGPAFPEEGPKGPLMIQGDHGPVAFRNIRYRAYEPTILEAKDLSYEVYTGNFEELPSWDKVEVAYTGDLNKLTQEVVRENEKFIFRLKGTVEVPYEGSYTFHLGTSGHGRLLVDGEEVVPYGWWIRSGSMSLEPGEHRFEVIYHKRDAWYPNGLGLEIEGPMIRRQPLHALSSVPLNAPTNPIGIEFNREPRLVRCFVDYPEAGANKEMRIVHAINVGFPSGISFTYDADRANMALAWRGDFLNATPMWNNRGDGSARPMGLTIALGSEMPFGTLENMQAVWNDELPTSYDFEGYSLDPQGNPIFHYGLEGMTIQDNIRPAEGKPYFTRTLSFSPIPDHTYYMRLATGTNIEEVSDGQYAIDQAYYINVKSGKAQVREIGSQQELLISLSEMEGSEITYEVIW